MGLVRYWPLLYQSSSSRPIGVYIMVEEQTTPIEEDEIQPLDPKETDEEADEDDDIEPTEKSDEEEEPEE